jgi:hypothetical protein
MEKASIWEVMVALAGVGALVTLGKLLESKEPLTWRLIIGRALVGGGLGASSSLLLLQFPDAPLIVLMGTACALASLGTSLVEAIVQKFLTK